MKIFIAVFTGCFKTYGPYVVHVPAVSTHHRSNSPVFFCSVSGPAGSDINSKITNTRSFRKEFTSG